MKKKHESKIQDILDIIYRDIEKLSKKKAAIEPEESLKLVRFYKLLSEDQGDELDLSELTDEELEILEKRLIAEEEVKK